MAECRAYDGPDKIGALMGELDCLIELEMLKENDETINSPKTDCDEALRMATA